MVKIIFLEHKKHQGTSFEHYNRMIENNAPSVVRITLHKVKNYDKVDGTVKTNINKDLIWLGGVNGYNK